MSTTRCRIRLTHHRGTRRTLPLGLPHAPPWVAPSRRDVQHALTGIHVRRDVQQAYLWTPLQMFFLPSLAALLLRQRSGRDAFLPQGQERR